jgi:hypothetical protein
MPVGGPSLLNAEPGGGDAEEVQEFGLLVGAASRSC